MLYDNEILLDVDPNTLTLNENVYVLEGIVGNVCWIAWTVLHETSKHPVEPP